MSPFKNFHGQSRAGKLVVYNFVQIDEDLTARINMADAKFSCQERGRVYAPAWMSPETLQKPAARRNWEAADMWSFSVLLWELATREVSGVKNYITCFIKECYW